MAVIAVREWSFRLQILQSSLEELEFLLPFALTLFTMMMTFFLLAEFFSVFLFPGWLFFLCEKNFSSAENERKLLPPLDTKNPCRHSQFPSESVDPSEEKRETSDPHVLLITQDSTALTLAIDRLQWFHHTLQQARSGTTAFLLWLLAHMMATNWLFATWWV